MPKPTRDVRILVDFPTDDWGPAGRYLKLRASVVAIGEYGGEKDLRPFSDDYGTDLSRLIYTGQMDPSCVERRGYDADFYGCELGFADLTRLSLRDAERAVKLLRPIHRRLDALAERFGRPDDSATALAHLADAVGAPAGVAFFTHAEAGVWNLDANGRHYRSMDANGLRYRIRMAVQEWADKYGFVQKVAS